MIKFAMIDFWKYDFTFNNVTSKCILDNDTALFSCHVVLLLLLDILSIIVAKNYRFF